MFVGVSRQRWIASGVLIVLGLAIFIGHPLGIAGGLVGIVLALFGLVLIGMTPKHHPPVPARAPKPVSARPAAPPAPRPDIEARDASEV